MTKDILEESKEFLKTYTDGKVNEYETVHPWRKDSEHVLMHSLRVHSLALKILENERSRLSEDDAVLIQVAAILHDIGKYERKENHAEKSAEIVSEWLSKNPHLTEQIHSVDKLIAIIEDHSNKKVPEEDLSYAILKDADILDEIGVLSIFMASNWIDRSNPFFFNELHGRLKTFELSYCDKQMKRLNTDSAKGILQEKIDFINAFIQQLGSELNGTEELYSEGKE
jgi:uncharacterized protein